jgi:TonB family protein
MAGEPNRTMKIPALQILLGLAIAAVAPAQPLTQISQSLKINQTVTPLFPASLISVGITEGQVHIAISVNEEGKLTDALVVSYTDAELAVSAMEAIKEWTFEPARRADGPVGSRVELMVRFEARGAVISYTLNTFLERYLSRMTVRRMIGTCEPAELDRPLAPTVCIHPMYPRELAQRGAQGDVVVEFYIDQTGAVRLPAVVESAHDQLSNVAVAALREWKFDPPTHHGEKVNVKALQRFKFALKG